MTEKYFLCVDERLCFLKISTYVWARPLTSDCLVHISLKEKRKRKEMLLFSNWCLLYIMTVFNYKLSLALLSLRSQSCFVNHSLYKKIKTLLEWSWKKSGLPPGGWLQYGRMHLPSCASYNPNQNFNHTSSIFFHQQNLSMNSWAMAKMSQTGQSKMYAFSTKTKYLKAKR